MGEHNNNSLKGILLAIIALLLASNTYFFCKSREAQQQNIVYVNKIQESDSLRNVLNNDYNEAMNQIAYYKGQNTQLDSALNVRTAELSNIKAKFDRIVSAKNLSTKELAAANALIVQMKQNKDEMLSEIERLKKANIVLVGQRDSLDSELGKEKLITSTLTTEKSQLDLEKKALAAKVEAGSIIRIDNMNVKGIRYNGSGKEKETSRAGIVDRIKVCFDAMDNKVVDKGKEIFFLRLIGPDGVTLSVKSLGSGEFTNKDINEKSMYTCSREVDYDNTMQNVCVMWEQDTPFKSGDYTAEIYNKGFLVGTSKFTLKKGIF